ncbi:unnamed protein product [Cuscuta epithymum]|uniref:Uncharacterized protein n=1 Tax=Cuscuta epithymum TaxID=186058 RepID=A0AAV0CW56_9ASTE|nr:unnamed protein product [Cuscuta epithymum]CAH9085194.1 unnamed protein product [Cuscuta epithymum]
MLDTWGDNNEGVDQEALNDLSGSSFLDFLVFFRN